MRFDIVIPSWNGMDLLPEFLKHLTGLLEDYKNEYGKVIIADDASTDNSVEFIRNNYPQIEVIDNRIHQGFSSNVNSAAGGLVSDIVFVLNNDIFLHKDYFRNVINCFNNSDDIFSVYGTIKDWDKVTLRDGGKIGRFKNGFLRCSENYFVKDNTQSVYYSFYCPGTAVAYHKEKFLMLGGFDEMYNPCNWEDTDICYRAWKNGWKNLYTPNAEVYHRPNTTIKKSFSRVKVKVISHRNRYFFVWKNINNKFMLFSHIIRVLIDIPLDFLTLKWWKFAALLKAIKHLPRIICHRRKTKDIVNDKAVFNLFKIIDYINNKDNPSFIIFRTDRIGDVVLSLETAKLIKEQYKRSRVTFVLRKYTKPLALNNPFIDEIVCIDEFTSSEFFTYLKKCRFDAALILFSDLKIAWSLFKANIKFRIGPMSKWWGVFYNIKVWQKRSRSNRNEAEYNIDLVKNVGAYGNAYPKLYLDESEIASKKEIKKSLNIKDEEKIIIIHPGSGNSAKNWPLDNFLKLAAVSNKEKNVRAFISGNKEELSVYLSISDKYNLSKHNFLPEYSLRDFIKVLSCADCVLTNSTGPLHCASALDIPTVSFFCPVRVCRPDRWGPFSDQKNKHYVFVPDVPECEKCIGSNCKYFNCMEMISVDKALSAVNDIILMSKKTRKNMKGKQ